MPTIHFGTIHMGAILWGVLAMQAASPLRPGDRQIVQSSASHPISPVAVVTWRTTASADGTSAFDLIVLWRGNPGWFASGSGRAVQSGSTGALFRTTASFGGLELEIRFEPKSRVAWIQGRRIALGDANVILVDHVDSADGPRVVGTRRVPSQVPPGSRSSVGMVLGQSPEVVSFLQCDAGTAPSNKSPDLAALCLQLGTR